MEPLILSSIIQGVCSIIAAITAASAAALIGVRFLKMSKLEEKLKTAVDDIEFLLAVEEEHCKIHKDTTNNSNKNKVRQIVRRDKDLSWSGVNTPGRIRNP